MKCTACGEDIPDKSRFCNLCGVRLPPKDLQNDATRQTPGTPAPAVPATPVPANGPRKPAADVAPRQPTRAEKLQLCLDRIVQKGDLPAFSHNIHKAMGLLGTDDASLRRLTNIILQDYGLLLVVMRRANSPYYNRSGKPICSVTHAVAMLGVDSIRNLASGLLLLEHFGGKSENLRTLMLLASLTACEVRSLAHTEGFSRLEEAYLCGMFRNLGEVLVSSCFPKEHASIMAKMAQKSWTESEASQSVLGFTFEDLGQAMSRRWGMPESVSETMNSPQLSQLNASSPRSEIFCALVAFCNELTREVFLKDQKGSQTGVQALIQRYDKVLNINSATVRDLLNQSVSETKECFQAARMPLDELRLRRRSEAAVEEAHEEVSDKETAGIPEVVTGIKLLDSMETEVANTLESGAEFDVNKVLLMVLEAVYRGGEFSRALFCLTTRDRTAIRGRMGLGENVDAILHRFSISLTEPQEQLAVSLLQGVDLYVSPEEMAHYRHSRIVQSLNPSSFGLFPIIIEELVIGCIYFDHTSPDLLVSSDVLKIIGKLRDSAARAIRRSRQTQGHVTHSDERP